MLALSLWQPWATLAIIGAKPYEFRSWPLTRGNGVRYAIHAARRKPRQLELVDIRTRVERGVTDGMDIGVVLDVLDWAWRNPASLPLGCVLGTVVGGKPVMSSTLFAGGSPDLWANPLSDPVVFEEPIPAKGKQGWWNWADLPASDPAGNNLAAGGPHAAA